MNSAMTITVAILASVLMIDVAVLGTAGSGRCTKFVPCPVAPCTDIYRGTTSGGEDDPTNWDSIKVTNPNRTMHWICLDASKKADLDKNCGPKYFTVCGQKEVYFFKGCVGNPYFVEDNRGVINYLAGRRCSE